ncbi:uncharacterized protein [Gossypium hirsutum]|uniref:Chromo domain-containing protein n=1 Tax=Gossypium hirsutum TaxID=3635 RepID=A0A1U8KTN6_GOSHI|nr:uncharacterized protein LOC107920578 [Gossypium hirsutum]
MFTRLSLFDDGNLLAESQVKPTWIDQIQDKQLGDDSLVLRFGQVEDVRATSKVSCIHDVFHVFMLRQYLSDPSHVVSVDEIEVIPNLTFEEELIQILDPDIKVLRRKYILLMKALWRNHDNKEATWELEDPIHQQYSHMFESSKFQGQNFF